MGFYWDTSSFEHEKYLKAEDVNNGVDAMFDFINQGIGNSELRKATVRDNLPYTHEGWVDSKIIYRPEFYGAPSPRMMAVSGQAHYRETPNDYSKGAVFNVDLSGSSHVGVPGACTRLKLRHDAQVNIMCSFYMFEGGGIYKSLKTAEDNYPQGFSSHPRGGGYETNPAGYAYLSINGSRKASTQRTIYTSTVDPRRRAIDITGEGSTVADWWADHAYMRFASRGFPFMPMIGRKQQHIIYQASMSEGVHDIGLVFMANENSGFQRWINPEMYSASKFSDKYKFHRNTGSPEFPREKQIFFLARNLVVDGYYVTNTPV